MKEKALSGGTVHRLPADIRKALVTDRRARAELEERTPLARNEWICWVTSVKKVGTRENHIKRLVSELKEGVRRPCCWIGCIHRKDKAMAPSIHGILNERSKKKNLVDL